MKHSSFTVLFVGATGSRIRPAYQEYFANTPLRDSYSSDLPKQLESIDVLVVDPAELSLADWEKVEAFTKEGGACLGLCAAFPLPASAELFFSTASGDSGPECEVRVLFQDHAHCLAIRFPDAFYHKGKLLPLIPKDGEVEIILYADWRYRHKPVLTARKLGQGRVALTTLQELTHPLVQKLIYRLLHFLAGREISKPPLGVGLLGYPPSVGELHAKGTLTGTPGLGLKSICDLNAKRLASFQESFPGFDLCLTQDSRVLGEDPEIDLVVIATPPNSHFDLARQMLEMGKHVIVEKPFTLTRASADQLLDLADRQNLLVACHQNRRWDGDFLAIKEAAQEKLIGEIFYMETFVGGYAHPCGFWHSEETVSGGTTFDWGAHYLDWMLDLMPGPIVEVRCTRQNRVWQDITNADQERIQVRFADGREAEFIHSDIAFLPKPKWYILGTEGSIVGQWREVVAYEVDPVQYYCAHEIPSAELGADLTVKRLQGRNRVIEQNLPLIPRESFPFHANLADHLLLGEPLMVPGQHTARVVAVLETAKHSAENHGRVEQVEI